MEEPVAKRHLVLTVGTTHGTPPPWASVLVSFATPDIGLVIELTRAMSIHHQSYSVESRNVP